MPADRTDPGRRDPQCLQWRVPAATRGLPQPAAYLGRQDQIPTGTSFAGALVNSAPTAAFAGAFLGCLATLHFSAGGFVPAIASALATTLLCGALLITRTTSLFPGELFAAIYGGSFAGMTPLLGLGSTITAASVMPATALFILLSIASGLAFCVVAEIDARSGRRLAAGCGGRSGAIATVASFLFVEVALLFGADGHLFRAARADMSAIDPRSLALTGVACTIGMCATLAALRRRSVASAAPAERIFVAAVVALLGLMVLYLNDANDTHTLDAFYAGCFLGMSTPDRLKGWIQSVLAVILLTAMLVIVKALLPDIGGALGFAAFATMAVLLAPTRLTTWTMTWLATGNLTHGKHQQTATQPSARRDLFAERHIRGAFMIASLAGVLVMGWFALPYQVASERPAPEMASASVAGQPERILEQAAVVQVKPGAVDEAIVTGLSPGTASADALNADPALSLELNVSDIQAAQVVVGAAETGAAPAHDDAATGATTATTGAVQRETRIDEATQSNAEIFREFVEWRAARYGPIARPRPQPVKRSRTPALQMVRLTPPASIRTAPRAPIRAPATRPAPGPAHP